MNPQLVVDGVADDIVLLQLLEVDVSQSRVAAKDEEVAQESPLTVVAKRKHRQLLKLLTRQEVAVGILHAVMIVGKGIAVDDSLLMGLVQEHLQGREIVPDGVVSQVGRSVLDKGGSRR